MKKIRIAIGQFPVSENIKKNEKYISKHIVKAFKKNADIIHFPETSLSGYHFKPSVTNWTQLKESLNRIKLLAKQFKINIVLGSHYQRNKNQKPYNCTYLISKSGQITGNYFKSKLYKKEKQRFSSKDNFLIKEINGTKCGFLICYDSCFPKLFQHYRNQNVKLLFLSYYNAKNINGKNSLNDLIEAQLRTRASDNLMHISASNSSARYSRMPSCIVSPDSQLKKTKRHKSGILIYEFPKEKLGWTFDNQK